LMRDCSVDTTIRKVGSSSNSIIRAKLMLLLVWQILKFNISRSFALTSTQPILWFWNACIAVVYGVFYLYFTTFPLIYQGLRGWSSGLAGLPFLAIGAGVTLTISIEPLIRRMIKSHKNDPEIGGPAPEATLSIICKAAILV
jgi:hypothetical protein